MRRRHRGGRSGGPTASVTASDGAERAGFARRLGASVYEALLLTALLLAVSFALLPLLAPDTAAYRSATAAASATPALYALGPAARAWSGAVLLAACAAYCIGLWSGGRRTLPMATWGLALVTTAGGAVPLRTASLRFLACGIGPALALAAAVRLQPVGLGRWAPALLAINYAWALFDGDRQFLQDRIAGTRLIVRTAPRG